MLLGVLKNSKHFVQRFIVHVRKTLSFFFIRGNSEFNQLLKYPDKSDGQ